MKRRGRISLLLFLLQRPYRHAGAALGEVDHRGVELVFEEISVCHHGPSQRQAGGGHQDCSYHHGLGCTGKGPRGNATAESRACKSCLK